MSHNTILIQVPRLWRGQQTWGTTAHFHFRPKSAPLDQWHTLRIEIHRDRHLPKSYAQCKRWDGHGWRRVCELHYSLMESAAPYGLGEPQPNVFEADVEALSELAEGILSPVTDSTMQAALDRKRGAQ